jgi:outer membrane biosynthesis protein TonB
MAKSKQQDTIVVAATGASKGKPADTVVKVMELVEENLVNPKVEVVDANHPPKSAKGTRYKKVDQKAKPAHQPKPKAQAKPATKPKAKAPSLVKEVDAEAQARIAALRQEETKAVFDTANRWANREDLSPLERCHGTAHEVYVMDHHTARNGHKQQQARHESYMQQFDQRFAGEIEQRRIRAARELFPS